MKNYLKKKGIRVGVVVLIAAILVGVCTHAHRSGQAGAARNAAASLSGPVQKAATALTDWMERIYASRFRYDQLAEENESLRRQLSQAQADAREVVELREENERLRQLLELAEKRRDFTFEAAKVTARGSSNWSSTLTISKGEDYGIEVNDCVVTETEMLVGQVIEVGDSWATVRTLIDVDFSAGAFVGEDRHAGMLVGGFSLMQKGCTSLTYLSEGAQMFVGDTVLTSGKGGAFPSGIVVGTVTEIREEAGGQSSYGVVKPSCELDTLSQVFVIKDFQVVE